VDDDVSLSSECKMLMSSISSQGDTFVEGCCVPELGWWCQPVISTPVKKKSNKPLQTTIYIKK